MYMMITKKTYTLATSSEYYSKLLTHIRSISDGLRRDGLHRALEGHEAYVVGVGIGLAEGLAEGQVLAD